MKMKNNRLKIEEYQVLAKRTMVNISEHEDLIHMEMGVITEVAECVDLLKKELAYKKPLDINHLAEEIGDILWYLANQATISNVKLESVISKNFTLSNRVAKSIFIYNSFKNLLDSFLNDEKSIFIQSNYNKIDIICKVLELDINEIMYRNIEKLKVRYPDKFSTENALNRNLDEENKVLNKEDKRHFPTTE
jgi:NTP pyrophosphatase (non-canonical NTP hydrolase)